MPSEECPDSQWCSQLPPVGEGINIQGDFLFQCQVVVEQKQTRNAGILTDQFYVITEL